MVEHFSDHLDHHETRRCQPNDRLQDRLGTKVKIDYLGKGGKITIRYSSPNDLERIYRHLFEPDA